jgi:hypothetical protein
VSESVVKERLKEAEMEKGLRWEKGFGGRQERFLRESAQNHF